MKRGKPSAGDKTTKPVVAFTRRLPPAPKELSSEEASVWRSVIASHAGDMIGVEAYPLLIEYSKQVVTAQVLGEQVRRFKPEWAVDEEGLRRWDRLIAMHDRVVSRMANLAVKLRLTPSTRVDKKRAATITSKGSTADAPWDFTG
jgi:hypothetical protein